MTRVANLDKVGKISNFDAVGDGSDKGNLGKVVILVL